MKWNKNVFKLFAVQLKGWRLQTFRFQRYLPLLLFYLPFCLCFLYCINIIYSYKLLQKFIFLLFIVLFGQEASQHVH